MNPAEIVMTAVLLVVVLALLAAMFAPLTFDPSDHPPKSEGSDE